MVSAWSGVQHAMAEAEIPQAKGTAGSIPLWGWEEVPSSYPMAQQCCFTGVFDAQGQRAIKRLPRYYNYMHIPPYPCAKHAESQENDIHRRCPC